MHQYEYLGFSRFLVFNTHFLKIQNKIKTILKFKKNEIDVKETGLAYAHATFGGNSMIVDTQIVQKTMKTVYTILNAFLRGL